MEVTVVGEDQYVWPLCLRANRLQVSYHFGTQMRPGALPLFVTHTQGRGLFTASRNSVRVSLWQSAGLCRYAGLALEDYLVICSALGIIYHIALLRNPWLKEEDLLHNGPPECLFTSRDLKQEYAFPLEHMFICPSCVAFFASLEAGSELETLTQVMATIRLKRGKVQDEVRQNSPGH